MANQSGYTDGELMKMQQDAVRRVREMQRRTQAYAEASFRPAPQQAHRPGGRLQFQPKGQPTPRQGRPAPNQSRSRPHPDRPQDRHAAPQNGGGGRQEEGTLNPGRAISRLLNGIQFDSDTIIILGLAWLLFKNGGSYKLILALLYILL